VDRWLGIDEHAYIPHSESRSTLAHSAPNGHDQKRDMCEVQVALTNIRSGKESQSRGDVSCGPVPGLHFFEIGLI
jgi:hypothetical protein